MVDKKEPLSAEIPDPDESGDWDVVRDSWVHPDPSDLLVPAGTHPPARERTGVAGSSLPPPLAPPHVVSAMLERLAAGDYEGTLIAARAALAIHPTNDDAIQCRDMAMSSLAKLYASRLGLVEGRRFAPRRTGVRGDVDLRARSVLRQVDGVATTEQIIASVDLQPLETLRCLSELALANVIVLVPETD